MTVKEFENALKEGTELKYFERKNFCGFLSEKQAKDAKFDWDCGFDMSNMSSEDLVKLNDDAIDFNVKRAQKITRNILVGYLAVAGITMVVPKVAEVIRNRKEDRRIKKEENLKEVETLE